MDKLLLKLLDTQLNALQQQRVQDHLFDLIVEERLSMQRLYIEVEVSNELEEMSLEQKIELLKTKLK